MTCLARHLVLRIQGCFVRHSARAIFVVRRNSTLEGHRFNRLTCWLWLGLYRMLLNAFEYVYFYV